MYIISVAIAAKIPAILPQILSYFSSADLSAGTLVEVPLGRRKETGVVLNSKKLADIKLEIKKADFELKNISKVISQEPILTAEQITLGLFLGQYYFASAGYFLKMSLPKKIKKMPPAAGQKTQETNQELIIAPSINEACRLFKKNQNAILWHSELTQKKLNENWWKIKNKQTEIIIGARSAVFLPFSNLKKITIADETNSSHKSWDKFPHYKTHEAVKKLTEMFNAELILDSRAPSIKIKNNNQFTIKNKIETRIIDMRAEIKNSNFSVFSYALEDDIKKSLSFGKQTILFINRRGSNFLLCRDCGLAIKCKNCDAPLIQHLTLQTPFLLCHHCGYKENVPKLCPKCHSYRIKFVGQGAQKIEIAAGRFFPKAKITRLDSDAAPLPKNQKKIIEKFNSKEIDILITTQIIFSWLPEIKNDQIETAAILSADSLLNLPDFRSGEKAFQAIWSLKNFLPAQSNFIVQTYNPESKIILRAANNEWQDFYEEEISTRKILKYPPFAQIVKLTFRHKDPRKTATEAKILAEKLKRANSDEIAIINHALPAFISKEKGKFVWNIILRFPIKNFDDLISREFLLRRNSLLQYVPPNWEIDVDPENLL